MSNTAPQVVRTYLKQLDAALDGVPDSVRPALHRRRGASGGR